MKVRTLSLRVFVDAEDKVIGIGVENVAPVAFAEIPESLQWAIRAGMLFAQPRGERDDDLQHEIDRVYGETRE